MKKTIIALALAAAALNVAPVSAAQEKTDLRFNYTHAATCGIESVSGETGKLLVKRMEKPNPSGALSFKAVNNTKNDGDTVSVGFKISPNHLPTEISTPPRFSVYMAEYADLENSNAVQSNQTSQSIFHPLGDFKWNTEYKAQLKIENWWSQLHKLKGNSVTSATLTLMIQC